MNLIRHVCRNIALVRSSAACVPAYRPPAQLLFSTTAHQGFAVRDNRSGSDRPAQRIDAEQLAGQRADDERLFLIAQNDPDRFGAQHTPGLAVTDVTAKAAEDDGDRAEDDHLLNASKRQRKRLRTKQYADMIKEHMRNRRLKEAIDVLEVRMLKTDRVQPENYIYNLLIGECGRLGYTKKAFGLFTRMKQRGLKPTGGTYTALFNACANTPWPQDGLQKIEHLRQLMPEPNVTNYNAMIKAYGRCGDLPAAFRLVDEMQTKRLPVDVQTLNFVLHACASDRELGFRHALLVWHKMLRRKMVPDVYSFNLLLRCVRDCGLGDLETMQQVIGQILTESRQTDVPQLTAESEQPVLRIEPKPNDGENAASGTEVATVAAPQQSEQLTLPQANETPDSDLINAPNLLSSRPHLGKLVALAEIRTAEDRLLLLGGSSGFLREMALHNCAPDVKTFTELIEVLPPTNTAEKRLLAAIKRAKIPVDVDLFNVLMKKRSMRFDYDGAKEVLGLIRTANLKPDIVTYGVLALSCRTPDAADELMQEMLNNGHRMNIQILGAMLKQGCAQHNFEYVLKIMQLVYHERIRPNEQFLMHLVRFRTNCFEFRTAGKGYAKTKKFRDEFKRFCNELEDWREKMGLHDLTLKEQINAVRDHPWEQFKYDQPEGMEELKNPKLRHKTKLRRHIQRIKPELLSEGETPAPADDRQRKSPIGRPQLEDLKIAPE